MKATFITGASSGLGKEFAKIYARYNNNLVLLGTNEERLEATKKEVLDINNNIKVFTKVCDLSLQEELKKAYEFTRDNDLFINNLVNCAGFGDQKKLSEMDIDLQLKMTEVNCNAPLYFTKAFLGDMIKNDEGHIINVASIAGLYPGPYMSTYHATKAFLISLSDAVSYEVRKTNIKVLTLCPGPFNSGFVARAHNDYTFKKLKPIEASTVAKIAYEKSMKGKKFFIIGFKNRLTYFASRFVGRKMLVSSSAKLLDKNRD